MTDAKLKITVDSRDVERGNKSLKELAETGGKAEKSTKQLTSATETLTRAAKTAAGALAVTFSTREIIQYSDAWQSASNQLRLVTDSASQLAEVQRILLGVSNETRSSFESTANLYTRLTRATTDMGLSQQELVGLTKTINQSFAVSGATATEAAAAITQLSQGLAAGALRGDEFNSVAEQAPGIMMAIAESLGMTVGELRGFAAEGGITAQIVVDALQGAAASIEEDYGKAIKTFGQSVQVAQNNVMEFIGTNDALQGSVSRAGDTIVFLSENMDILQAVLITTSAVVASRYIPAMISATTATASMTSATAAFGGALRLVGGPIGATIIAVGALATAYVRLEKTAKQATENAFNYNVAQGARTIELAMYDLTQQLADVRDRTTETIEAYDEAYGNRDFREVAALEVKLADLRDEQSELTGELVRYAGELKNVKAAQLEFDDSTVSVSEGVDALTNQFLILRPELLGATGETLNLVDAFDLLSPAIYEGGEASQTATGYMGELSHEINYQRNMVENLQREWANLIVTLIDGESDIGDFFDTVAKGFVRMVAEMASADLTSMIFGGTGGNLSGLISGGVSATAGGSGISGLVGGAGLSGLASSAAQFIGGLTGTGVGAGSAIVGAPTAATAAGMNAAAFAGPAAIAAAALIAGKVIHDKTNDPDGFHRGMAGFLGAPTPGAPSGSQFGVTAFTSGFRPVGFADGPASRQEAQRLIEEFRFVDSTITDLVRGLGGAIDLSKATLGGFGLDGSGSGTFFGRSQRTTDSQFAQQLDSFAWQLGQHVSGLDEDIMNAINQATTFQQLVDALKANTDATAQNTGTLSIDGGVPSDIAGPFKQAALAGIDFGGSSAGSVSEFYSETARLARVGNNISRVRSGYDPVTGTWANSGSMGDWWQSQQAANGIRMPTVIPKPTYSIAAPGTSAIGLTGQTIESENQKLLMMVEKNTANMARILDKFDGDGLPEERA